MLCYSSSNRTSTSHPSGVEWTGWPPFQVLQQLEIRHKSATQEMKFNWDRVHNCNLECLDMIVSAYLLQVLDVALNGLLKSAAALTPQVPDEEVPDAGHYSRREEGEMAGQSVDFSKDSVCYHCNGESWIWHAKQRISQDLKSGQSGEVHLPSFGAPARSLGRNVDNYKETRHCTTVRDSQGGSVWVMGEWSVSPWILGVTMFQKIFGLYGLERVEKLSG